MSPGVHTVIETGISRSPSFRALTARREKSDVVVVLVQRHDLAARLHARTLLGEYELPPVKSRTWLAQKKGDLQREHLLPEKVLSVPIEARGPTAVLSSMSIRRLMTTSNGRRFRRRRAAHIAASRSSSARLRSIPHR